MRGTTKAALIAVAIAAVTQTATSQTRDERAIRAASDAWQRYIAAQQVDSIVALFTPDAMLMFANSPVIKGPDAIRATWSDVVKIPGYNVHWAPTRVDVASPTVATEYGTYTESYDTPQGKGTDAGNYVTIWHKINGKWRVALDAPNTTAPLPAAGSAAAPMEMGDPKSMAGSGLTWSDFSPAGFDPGMKLAVLEGDPGAKGPYVIRLQFPAGYRFPVHWHPGIENLTVVSGTFQLGMGNTADWNALKSYGPGDFLYIPPKHAHFGGSAAQAPSVVQLHGEGPFQVILGPPK